MKILTLLFTIGIFSFTYSQDINVVKNIFDGVERNDINDSYFGVLSSKITEGKINVKIIDNNQTVYSKWFTIVEKVERKELATCKCYNAIDEKTKENLEVRLCDKGILYKYAVVNMVDIKSNIIVKHL